MGAGVANITRRGKSQWRARVRCGGQSIGKTFASRDAAEQWATKTEEEIGKGMYSSRVEAESTTLSEALDRYLAEVTPQKRRPENEAGFVRRWKARPLAQRILATIRGKDIATYIQERRNDGVGANTIRLELALLSHLFNVARKEWGMESLTNPVELARKPRLPPGRDRRLVGDEEARLLAAAATYGGEIGPIITWAIETAMRRGKISAMRWEHVDQRARVLEIPTPSSRAPGRSKPTPKFLPLSTRAIAVLDSLPRQIDGRVWSMRPDSITQAFERVCEAADIEGLTFHDLRHEATSRLFEKGLNPMQVAAITGHKTLQMLKRYTHLRAEDLVGRLG